MLKRLVFRNARQRPVLALIATFLAWKFVILGIAAFSPGVGYDTSTDLFLETFGSGRSTPHKIFLAEHLTRKLTRWDALYFVAIASRGHLYEQEWAWWGFPKLVAVAAKLIPHSISSPLREALAGILLSNTAHLFSVIVLFLFCKISNVSGFGNKSAYIVACLHIVAPAGLFLSAPYGESLFSCLSISGYYCYAHSFSEHLTSTTRTAIHDAWLIGSSLLFGCACLARSNGLFNGLIYAFDLAMLVPETPKLLQSRVGIRYVASLIISGLAVGVGFVFPQYLAFLDFCSGGVSNPTWCENVPPSVYLFVQKYYWNVGFLRYWTVSNLPLFLLAAPMLAMMTASAIWVLSGQIPCEKARKRKNGAAHSQPSNPVPILARMMLPQAVLALLALTNFHVQIITRLSSAYPLLYTWIFQLLKDKGTANAIRNSSSMPEWIIKWTVMYSLVQGSLFASFLPPA